MRGRIMAVRRSLESVVEVRILPPQLDFRTKLPSTSDGTYVRFEDLGRGDVRPLAVEARVAAAGLDQLVVRTGFDDLATL
jgi:hypothetical protein